MAVCHVIAIEAAGALTPVGSNLTDSMIGLYTRVQIFEDLGIPDEEGEPISGMKVRFADDPPVVQRLTAMARAIVDEATLTVEPSVSIPMLLCCPAPKELGDETSEFPARLLGEVVANAAVSIDKKLSRMIPRGRAGVPEALAAALALLNNGSVPCCLVGGVDSFVDDGRLAALAEDGRVLTSTNKDGYVPGESGVMLLLTNRPGPQAMANWLGHASANDEAHRGNGRPITGAGFQQAMSKALAQAKLGFDDLGCLTYDFPGEQRYFEEMVYAGSRLAKGRGNGTVETPAFSVGETGAAAGFLSIAMLAFLQAKGVHDRPGMALLSSDGPERGAVVLGPILRR